MENTFVMRYKIKVIKATWRKDVLLLANNQAFRR